MKTERNTTRKSKKDQDIARVFGDEYNDRPGIQMLQRIMKHKELFAMDDCDLAYWDRNTGRSGWGYSDEFNKFIRILYESQFLLVYDWMSCKIWGERLLHDPERLRKADLMDLRLLMTAAARNDRFCENYLGSLASQGKIRIMFERIETILSALLDGSLKWNLISCGPEPNDMIEYLSRYDNFESMYWVSPGRLLAGEYPGDLDADREAAKIRFLVDSGIRQVISLMEENETNHQGNPFKPYDKPLRETAEAAGIDINIDRIPIKDMEVPTKAEMIKILDLIDRAHEEDRPVYVHCWGGRGRTGTVAGCYLIRHDVVDARVVLHYLKDMRRNILKSYSPSPQTKPQRDMVSSWKIGQ